MHLLKASKRLRRNGEALPDAEVRVGKIGRPVGTEPNALRAEGDDMSTDENSQDDPTEYKVGNKKPPKQFQFKPLQSGNPKGRPKGSLNLATLVAQQLQQTVTVTIKGEAVKMIKKKVIALQLVDNAAKGHLKTAQYVGQLEAQHAAAVSAASTAQAFQLPDKENLKFLARRIAALTGEGT
jgi:Family of unknown function (DUF5681)